MRARMPDLSNYPCRSCPASLCDGCPEAGMTRRKFLAEAGALAVGGLALSALPGSAAHRRQSSDRRLPVVVPLRVQPVLLYEICSKREATSWRPWGGIHTEQNANEEKERIGRELAEMAQGADFPLEILPLVSVQNRQQATTLAEKDHHVLIVYAASGKGSVLESLQAAGKWTLVFVRHRSGPVYLWYETVHPIFLRKTVDAYGPPGMDVQDVVVDRHAEILWRLRALSGLKNTLGKRIVAVGGPSGWGAQGQEAPARARELWKLEIWTVPYSELGERIKRARRDDALAKRCRDDADRYLRQAGVSLHTPKEFVSNAFVLTEIFKGLLNEAETDTITINNCMTTIMPLAETTACLPLSILNDEGYLAFCESDFVVIPSGVLLHYISGLPVFLNDPTTPHDGVVTLAHCTAPRKMNGEQYEAAKILTHFESDYGAAPKVEMRKGQALTVLDPDFASRRWLGFEGVVIDNPFLDICRTQIDVQIKGNCDRLLQEMRGFHWMVSYGNYLRETGYALKKVGVDWLNLTEPRAA